MAQSTSSPTITTDKSDYVPGETVVISGSGWTPNQAVALHIDETDSDLPWDSSVTADALGNISNSEFVIQTNDIGVLFTLTATQGVLNAWTQFTDVVGAGTAPNGDPGGFEIDGDLRASPSPSPRTDWLDTSSSSGVGGVLFDNGTPKDSTVTIHVVDACASCANTADDTFSGSNQLNADPNTYTWDTSTPNGKTDINNVTVHISKDSNGDRWITASADRLSTNGNAFIDFELNQAAMTKVTDQTGCSDCPKGHFTTDPLNASTGGRTPNDILITGSYGTGGSLGTVGVSQWKSVSGTYQWVDITSSIVANGAFVATNTVGGVAVPYGAFGGTTYSANQFVETSIDITKLITAAIDPCVGIEVKTIFVKTKTSTATTATLEDFVAPIGLSFSAGFTVSLTQSPVSCFGGSNGSVTVTVNGGTPPYSVTLGSVTQTVSTDGGSTIFTGLTAGSKTVQVVATGGCTKDATITVTQPASAVSASITSQTNVSCFGSSTGSVTVAGSGGTSPYTYSIDGTNFGVSGTFSNLAAGSYTVTVKDANGCTTTQAVTITQPASALGSSISSQTNVACFGGSTGSVTVAGSGGTSPYTYSIDGVHFGSSGTFSNLAAGSYTVTVKDANGCTTTQAVTITQPAAALGSSISSQTNVACFGGSTGSVTVAGSGGTSPYTYSIDGTNFGSSGTFSNLAAGSYTVTVKDANGCATTQAVTITQPASALTASALPTNPSCSGGTGSITVTASGGTGTLTYSIDGTTFQASNVFSGLAAGSYTITVKDANGCTTTTGATTVTIPTAVNASVTATPVSSPGATDGTIKVTVTGGTAPYTVTIGAVTQTIATSGGSTTFTGLAGGGYTVNISDANGCSIGIAEEISTPTVQVNLCSILSSIGTGGKTVFQVTLVHAPLSTPLTISYTMSGTAIFGKDYSLSGVFGHITIPAGKASATVTILALKNTARTTNRTATMTIINGPGYFATPPVNKATVIIRR